MPEPSSRQPVKIEWNRVLQKQKIAQQTRTERRTHSRVREPGNSGSRKTDEQEVQKDPGIVNRNDAKEAASVEGLEVRAGLAGIHENAANEKAGKDEEKIQCGPAEADGALRVAEKRSRGRHALLRDGVIDQNHHESESPQTVEFDEALLLGSGNSHWG